MVFPVLIEDKTVFLFGIALLYLIGKGPCCCHTADAMMGVVVSSVAGGLFFFQKLLFCLHRSCPDSPLHPLQPPSTPPLPDTAIYLILQLGSEAGMDSLLSTGVQGAT